MLTEQEARELLQRAAETIDVPLPQAIPSSRPRRWLVPIAASVAVALAVVAGTLVIADRDPEPVKPPGPVLPKLTGWTRGAAETELRKLGYRLDVVSLPSCGTGSSNRVLGTTPRGGTVAAPGTKVRLRIVTSAHGICFRRGASVAPLWDLADFAGRRGPAPEFDGRVSLVVNGESTTVSHQAARDPETWASSPLQRFLDTTAEYSSTNSVPFASTGDLLGVCARVHPPAGPAGTTRTRYVVARGDVDQTTETPVPGCAVLDVYVANTPGTTSPITAIIYSSWRLSTKERHQIASRMTIARRFVDFAKARRGTLPVDTPVALYLGGRLRKTIDAGDAADRGAYDLCPAYAERSCPMSAVTTMADYPHDPVVVPTVGSCVENPTPLHARDVGAADVVVLGVPEPATCADDFAVQVFFNDAAQIVAVNLLVGSP